MRTRVTQKTTTQQEQSTGLGMVEIHYKTKQIVTRYARSSAPITIAIRRRPVLWFIAKAIHARRDKEANLDSGASVRKRQQSWITFSFIRKEGKVRKVGRRFGARRSGEKIDSYLRQVHAQLAQSNPPADLSVLKNNRHICSRKSNAKVQVSRRP